MSKLREEDLTEYLISDQARFYRIAYSYLNNREDALDAVQSAVCKALEHYRTLQETAALRTWFYQILARDCTDHLRARRRVILMEPSSLDVGSYEDPLPQDGTLAQRVNSLPPDIRTVIRLRFYEGLTLPEIASVTGWNLNTVKTRLYSGLRKLKVSMEGETEL